MISAFFNCPRGDLYYYVQADLLFGSDHIYNCTAELSNQNGKLKLKTELVFFRTSHNIRLRDGQAFKGSDFCMANCSLDWFWHTIQPLFSICPTIAFIE